MIMLSSDSFSQYTEAWKAFLASVGLGGLFFLFFTVQYGYNESFLILHQSWGANWDLLMPHLTHLADGAMVGGVFGLIYARKKPELVFGLLVSLVLVAICVAFLKQGLFADWHRPASVFDQGEVTLLSLGKESRFSFPSGHSAAAACLGWFVATVWTRPLWGAIVGLTAVFLGFTRIYIGVHFPGDVAAGLLLGLLMAVAGTFLAAKAQGYLTQQAMLFQKRTKHTLIGLSLLFLLIGILNTLTKYYLT